MTFPETSWHPLQHGSDGEVLLCSKDCLRRRELHAQPQACQEVLWEKDQGLCGGLRTQWEKDLDFRVHRVSMRATAGLTAQENHQVMRFTSWRIKIPCYCGTQNHWEQGRFPWRCRQPETNMRSWEHRSRTLFLLPRVLKEIWETAFLSKIMILEVTLNI